MRHYAIVDCQFGSTGKGLLAGYLAKRMRPDAAVCAFGPNAGHTFVDGDGKKFVHVMLPLGALSPNIKTVFIGPGAVINPDILFDEHNTLHALGYEYELVIHEAAAVVQDRHRDAEAGLGKIGSTQKGTGACAAEKITRATPYPIVARDALHGTPFESNVVTVAEYNDRMDAVALLQIEGAQGFSLGVNSGFYPYCTYRDCSINQLMADCAVPADLRLDLEVYGTARTYPIRVNNKTGTSGPGYHDQKEITWESIGRQAELTTVTKLPRRIFTFSEEQIKQAVRMNGIDDIFLNFANYCVDGELESIARKIANYARVRWLGYGPSENDIVEGNDL